MLQVIFMLICNFSFSPSQDTDGQSSDDSEHDIDESEDDDDNMEGGNLLENIYAFIQYIVISFNHVKFYHLQSLKS